VNPAVQDELN
jgi:hypothetical protein